jgi:hypothetical protein
MNNFTKEDIITTNKFRDVFPDYFYKTDIIYRKKMMKCSNRMIRPPKINQYLIISGNSDYPITNDLVDYYRPQIWYAINNKTMRENVFSLPLGITNNTNESILHPVYGNLDCMIQVMNEIITKKKLVYMNFNINTYYERRNVWELFKDKEWVTIGQITNTIEGRTQFLQQIKEHSFVLCPRGNGIDTHRLWETLYMGSIPIVIYDSALVEFNDLPICFIDNWEMITKDFLEKELERFHKINWSLDKLKIDYWINKIKSHLFYKTNNFI